MTQGLRFREDTGLRTLRQSRRDEDDDYEEEEEEQEEAEKAKEKAGTQTSKPAGHEPDLSAAAAVPSLTGAAPTVTAFNQLLDSSEDDGGDDDYEDDPPAVTTSSAPPPEPTTSSTTTSSSTRRHHKGHKTKVHSTSSSTEPAPAATTTTATPAEDEDGAPAPAETGITPIGEGVPVAQEPATKWYDGEVIRYSVEKTGYYCVSLLLPPPSPLSCSPADSRALQVGTVPVTLVSSRSGRRALTTLAERASSSSAKHGQYSGTVRFANVFEGELPAADHPKIAFYLFLTALYVLFT